MVIFLKYNIKIRGAVDTLIGIFLGGWDGGGYVGFVGFPLSLFV